MKSMLVGYDPRKEKEARATALIPCDVERDRDRERGVLKRSGGLLPL